MRFWSEGLGDRQLAMNLGKAHIKRQDEIILLTGVVDSPAPWEYEVKIQRGDWARILDTAATKEACDFIVTHTTFRQLLAMAWSIIVFVLLLAWFRGMRLLGLSGAPGEAAPSGEQATVAVPVLQKK